MKILRELISKIKYLIWYGRYKRINRKYKINVADTLVTLQEIEKNKSIIRFGDGEFLLMNGCGIKFQKENDLLAKRLREILWGQDADDNQMISIPYEMTNLSGYTKESKKFWVRYLSANYSKIYPFINFNKTYYDSQVTRIYINRENKTDFQLYLQYWKRIWDKKDLLIVEGELTRFGVGNDLLDNANSVERIICPAENAFEIYDQILELVINESSGKLVMAALGPTATVLAYDLSKMGIRCLDMGNLDIEYEWYKRNVSTKCRIEGKYSFEMDEGTEVEEIDDASYMGQIKGRVGI